MLYDSTSGYLMEKKWFGTPSESVVSACFGRKENTHVRNLFAQCTFSFRLSEYIYLKNPNFFHNSAGVCQVFAYISIYLDNWFIVPKKKKETMKETHISPVYIYRTNKE